MSKQMNLLHSPLKTGERLRRLCEDYGTVAFYDKHLRAWKITRDPSIPTSHEWTIEWVLPEQLETLTGLDIIHNFRPKVEKIWS